MNDSLLPAIRPERAADHAAVRAVNEAAFGQPAEADLVDRLRGRVAPCVSLVAADGEQIVGHAFFTPVRVGESADLALALGPMAVAPARQRAGVGTALVRAGLDAARAAGAGAAFVLGHPEYYPRFGFQSAAPVGLRCRWEAPPEAFMVIELQPGWLEGRAGLVRYDAAFDEV